MNAFIDGQRITAQFIQQAQADSLPLENPGFLSIGLFMPPCTSGTGVDLDCTDRWGTTSLIRAIKIRAYIPRLIAPRKE